MYTLFSISRQENAGFFDKIRDFFKIPNIRFKYLYDDSQLFLTATLVIHKNISEQSERNLVSAALNKLFKLGARTVLLPIDFEQKLATDAGLTPYHADNSLFARFAPEITSLAFNKIRAGKYDIWSVFLSSRLGKTFERTVLSCVRTSRYISIDCGEFSEILSDTLLREYGISSCGCKSDSCKKVLILFSCVPKSKIWEITPDFIINFSGESLEYDAAEIISRAEFSVPAEYTENLPKNTNVPSFISLLVESGYLDISEISISDIF